MATILLADNHLPSLETRRQLLELAHYKVVTASSPEEAREKLLGRNIDLAILDIRLKNDGDEADISGLEIATDRAFRDIPKILLTGFVPTAESLRRALGPVADEVPPAVAYVAKTERNERLLEVIVRTLEVWPQVLSSTIKVARQIRTDYEAARGQARLNYRLALAVSIIGFLSIFAGIALAWYGLLTIGIVGTASGIILQALSYLFFRRLDLSNDRLDAYHRELLETYWLEFLISASDKLPAERQVATTERAIVAAIDRWLAAPCPKNDGEARRG